MIKQDDMLPFWGSRPSGIQPLVERKTEELQLLESVYEPEESQTVPTLLANLFMNRVNTTSATLVLAKAYLGTLYKLIVSIVLFIYVFENIEDIKVNAGIFFSGYVIAFVTQYALSFFLHKSN